MRSKSASTTLADPYRAGLTLGTTLAEIAPEVVFLFCTMHYPQRDELVAGLYDGLGDDGVVLIGASGDGFLERSQVADIGACALALSSNGRVRWHLAHAGNALLQPQQALRSALAQLHSAMQGRDPAFYFLLSDFNLDASELEIVLRDEVRVPLIGGMAADDNSQMQHCCLFANHDIVPDALVLLACDGPLEFQVHIGNSIATVGSPGRVESAHGKTVQRIDGMTAAGFVERATGKPFMRSDQGSVSMTILHDSHPFEKKLRAVVQNSNELDGALKLHGGVQAGDMVQVCLASPAQLQQEVRHIVTQARASGFQAQAALIISCAGRKALLGGQIQFEVQAVSDAFGAELPIAGFPSFGEIGPLLLDADPAPADLPPSSEPSLATVPGAPPRRYTRNLFHNMTYMLLLFGGCDE